eukprot:1091818-Lingulodinium_polyedra.AAC.1
MGPLRCAEPQPCPRPEGEGLDPAEQRGVPRVLAVVAGFRAGFRRGPLLHRLLRAGARPPAVDGARLAGRPYWHPIL